MGNQTPAEARRALEQFEGSMHDHCQAVVCEANNERALAETETEEYEIQTRKLSLSMKQPRAVGHTLLLDKGKRVRRVETCTVRIVVKSVTDGANDGPGDSIRPAYFCRT